MATAKYEVYVDESGEFRGRLKAGNGEVVFDSAEGYENKKDVIKMAAKFLREGIKVVDVTEQE